MGKRNVFFNLTSRKIYSVDYVRLLYTRYKSDHITYIIIILTVRIKTQGHANLRVNVSFLS